MDDPLMVYLTLIQNFLQMFLETSGLTVDHNIWIHMLHLYCTVICSMCNSLCLQKKMNILYFRNPY